VAQVRDHRGQRHGIKHHPRAPRPPATRTLKTAIGRVYALHFAWVVLGLIGALFWLMPLAYIAASWVLSVLHVRSDIGAAVIGYATVGLWVWLIGIPVLKRLSDRIHRYENRCLACGYELRGLSAEPDGCSVCPECGAAWNWTSR